MLRILVLHWGDADRTENCVRSLFDNDCDRDFKVVIINNGDNEFSCPRLTDAFQDRLILLNSERNLGFAGGMNLGIRMAISRGAQFVLLLNNDTFANPAFLSELIEAAERYPQVGIFGCKVFYSYSEKQLWYAGGSIDQWLGRTRHFGFRKRDGEKYGQSKPVTFVTGCAMLVRVQVFAQIGLLDDSLFLYYEDADFCQRAHRAGIKIRYIPQAVLYHEVGAGKTGNLQPRYLYYHTRNRYLVLKRRGGFVYRAWLLFLHTVVYFGFRYLHTFLKRKKYRREHRLAIWRGFRDSLNEVTGPRNEYELQ